MSTNVPPIEFISTGLVIPTESAVLAGVQADINTAFGGDVNPALETPQGQIASSQTAIIGDKNDKFAYFVNQVNPDYAEGFMQDAIGRIYFIDRIAATSTVVTAACVGAEGTIIPIGARAQDTSGNLYTCTNGGTISVSGTISLDFACVETGPIPCPIASLTTIYQTIPGWDTITNAAAGTLGRDVESRIDFEFRRKNSVALNARGSLASIYAAIMDVEGVLDAYCFENSTNAAILVGETDYSMLPHSIYVAVVGGSNADIAQAILIKKDLGCDMNGNTTVTAQDDINYSTPFPTYTYKFQRTAALPILFAVSIVDSSSLPANAETLIKDAIIAAFAGTDGGQKARIGSSIFASRFYAPVTLVSPFVSILSILIGTATATLNQVNVGIDEHPTIDASDIVVTLV